MRVVKYHRQSFLTIIINNHHQQSLSTITIDNHQMRVNLFSAYTSLVHRSLRSLCVQRETCAYMLQGSVIVDNHQMGVAWSTRWGLSTITLPCNMYAHVSLCTHRDLIFDVAWSTRWGSSNIIDNPHRQSHFLATFTRTSLLARIEISKTCVPETCMQRKGSLDKWKCFFWQTMFCTHTHAHVSLCMRTGLSCQMTVWVCNYERVRVCVCVCVCVCVYMCVYTSLFWQTTHPYVRYDSFMCMHLSIRATSATF